VLEATQWLLMLLLMFLLLRRAAIETDGSRWLSEDW
jgi:hypothetical protein